MASTGIRIIKKAIFGTINGRNYFKVFDPVVRINIVQ
jgi:hypothetical protein